MMKHPQKITSLPFAGAISGLTHGETGNLWLCSPAGLFYEQDGQFRPQAGLPFQGASAVLALGKAVLSAGYPNHLLISPDEGRTWFQSRCEQVSAPVTCFVASPNFNRDAILLAGTDGDGLLRSTDGGHSWQLSNFGLRSFNILTLACAPDWEPVATSSAISYRYEFVFAATEEGVYQSPNGGRAWRFAGKGLPASPILSLAVSLDFKRLPALSDAQPSFHGTVFAGTDGAGLYRSQDGGQSWQTLHSFPQDAIVNALHFTSQGILLAATGEQGILASADFGATWSSRLEIEDSVLCLGEWDGKLLAGTAESGLLVL
jgi:photosystem II stability/assembly factor-like uncharacterized protein